MFKLIRNLSLLGALGILAACTTPQVRQAASPGESTTTVTPQYNVSKNGVQVFCATSFTVTGTNYNFLGDCGTTPPPIDPAALTTGQIKYSVHGALHPLNNVNLRDYGQIVGRIDAVPINPPALGNFPYVSGASYVFTIPANRYQRSSISPAAGIAPNIFRVLSTVSYNVVPRLQPVRVAIVPAGAPWPTGADTGCYKHQVYFDDNAVLSTTTNPADQNPYRCKLLGGGQYDLLVGYSNPTLGGQVAFWWH